MIYKFFTFVCFMVFPDPPSFANHNPLFSVPLDWPLIISSSLPTPAAIPVGNGGAPEPPFFFQKFIRKRDRLDFRARLLIVSIMVTPLPFFVSVVPDSAVTVVAALVFSDEAGRVGQLCEAVVLVCVGEVSLLLIGCTRGEVVAVRSVESLLIILVPRVLGDKGILLVVALVAWLAQS
jgi:hypothetical protein